MRDGHVRRVIKRLAGWRYQVDLWVTAWMMRRYKRPHYRLGGACGGCARCCDAPAIRANLLFVRLRFLRWALLIWHRVVNGFEYVGEDRQQQTFTFRCTHLDSETRLCDSYDSRPGMCRDYPRNLLYFDDPLFFPECGFRAVDQRAGAFKRALARSSERLELPDERRADLERRLHVRE